MVIRNEEDDERAKRKILHEIVGQLVEIEKGMHKVALELAAFRDERKTSFLYRSGNIKSIDRHLFYIFVLLSLILWRVW